jgi:Spy/CpxP family protein refolding chaperone
MNTLLTRLALTLATFGIAGIIHTSTAEAAPAGGKDRSAARGDRLCARLACSADQKAKIQAIKTSKAPQMKAARDQLRALKAEVQAELRKPSPDAKAIARIDARIDSQRAALHSQRRAAQLQLLALLTPDQRSKLLAHADKRGGKGEGKGKHRGEGRRRGPRAG